MSAPGFADRDGMLQFGLVSIPFYIDDNMQVRTISEARDASRWERSGWKIIRREDELGLQLTPVVEPVQKPAPTIVRTIETSSEFGGGGEYGVYQSARYKYALYFWSDGVVTWTETREGVQS